ncbi:MAG: 6-carboxytetrahydropterin synthase [Castellaniella sp.]|uniref:6-pyruvoyl trahydropterin synthase family protein n=1 Tax=Castellaniella sp. TaxID=1955812 RepID=UPI0012150A71|nr:6-carboxytetrahydropterin synthase [Castellaniella sp.]TAN27576.1 MAG: 6-carboxytetrahydropterin synthase [Castellaniella sp.]
MYSLTVRDQMMIAHSFTGAAFGPAQNLHGATYVVDVTFGRPALDADGLVVDIGAARSVLGEILVEFNLRNLDDLPDLAGHNTTTEFMARVVFDRVRQAIRSGRLGTGAQGLVRLSVVLHESPFAWAAYEADLQ